MVWGDLQSCKWVGVENSSLYRLSVTVVVSTASTFDVEMATGPQVTVDR